MTDPGPQPQALALVTAEMDAVALRKAGFLNALQSEAGPLVRIGLAFTAVAVAAMLFQEGLAGVGILALALVPGISLLGLALWLDRNEPEPLWLLIRCFLWGAGPAILFSGIANGFVKARAGVQVAEVVSAPILEEAMKGLALLWLLRHRAEEINGRLDAAVYAIFVGIGFAMVENIDYYAKAFDTGTLALVVLARGVMTPFAHPFFTLSTAIGIAAAARRRGPVRFVFPLCGYLGAVVLHSLWNANPGFWILVAPVFMWLCVRTVRASGRERAAVRTAIAAAVKRGDLPSDAEAVIAPGARPRLREWTAAAGDPGHPLHERWRRRHLAWIMASQRAAEQIAAEDPKLGTTPAQVQVAACELLRRRLTSA